MLFRASLKTLSLLYVLVLLLLWYLSPFLGARLGDWGRVVAPLLCLLLPAFLYVLIFRLNPNTYFRLALGLGVDTFSGAGDSLFA